LGHWQLEFGFYLYFGAWCLKFLMFGSSAQQSISITMSHVALGTLSGLKTPAQPDLLVVPAALLDKYYLVAI
jgi:hypothetical protein